MNCDPDEAFCYFFISFTRGAVAQHIQNTRGTRFSNPEEERAQAELITAEHALAAGRVVGYTSSTILAFSLVSSTCKATCGK
jgi:hypothetical protein